MSIFADEAYNYEEGWCDDMYYTCLTAEDRAFLDSFGEFCPKAVPPFVEDEVPF